MHQELQCFEAGRQQEVVGEQEAKGGERGVEPRRHIGHQVVAPCGGRAAHGKERLAKWLEPRIQCAELLPACSVGEECW